MRRRPLPLDNTLATQTPLVFPNLFYVMENHPAAWGRVRGMPAYEGLVELERLGIIHIDHSQLVPDQQEVEWTKKHSVV